MNLSTIHVLEILKNAESIGSVGFSGEYNFNEADASGYFEELIGNSASSHSIFSGVLAVEKFGNVLKIVDGIQRITTVCLLLCALCENYRDTSQKNEDARLKIFNRYLIHKGSPKLKLDGEDQAIYQKILFADELNEKEVESNLYRAYSAFINEIKSKNILGTKLFRIISKIQVMLVVTCESEVCTRDLYQSLNSNKEASQLNLIFDFIIQTDIKSADIWQQLASKFEKSNVGTNFGDFIKDFLTVQNNRKIPEKSALYNKFKSYFNKISQYHDKSTIINDICRYSKYYFKIFNADFEDEEIKNQVEMLNNNNGQDAYPYLMEVLDDLENGHINLDVFLDILIMVNSFIAQRQENPLSGITIDFASLSKELNKMLVSDDYAPEIIDENKLTINEMNKLSTFEV